MQIFSPILYIVFSLFIVFVSAQKLFSLMSSHLIFPFVAYTFRCHIQKIIAKTNVKDLFLMFSSKSFIVSGHTFKSLIHFELILLSGIR